MQTIREVRRLSDGAVKRVLNGVAARLILKGGYEYADGGKELDAKEMRNVAKTIQQGRLLSRFEKQESEVIKMKGLNVFDGEPSPELKKRLRGKRVLKKSVDFSPEKLKEVQAISKAFPSMATMTKDSNTLRNIIERTKQRRVKQ